MKKMQWFVAAIMCTSLLSAPQVFAKKGKEKEPEIANEAMWDSEPAPDNYDPNLKEEAAQKARGQGAESASDVANPIIVVDPGHGGSDPGAEGNGLQEKNITLDIASRSKNYIVANYPATVYMTRTSDTYVSLQDRTSYANSKGADFFVSMHINAADATSANGLETYYYYGSVNGNSLATDTYNKLKASYSIYRGVKEAGFYVLKYTNMPASLGETGFISNSTDAGNLATSSFRQNLATQYSQGMHYYWWGF